MPFSRLPEHGTWTALAPMQDVTTREFMAVIAHYGAPDLFFTEFFRVHSHSTLEKNILPSIVDNPTGKPIFAQMIGEHIPDLLRTARELQNLPTAGIDLNMGCPAPKVFKKNVGGGLLKDTPKIRQIFAALSQELQKPFTVKTRVGFEDSQPFDEVIQMVNEFGVRLLSVHGRTVKGLYRSPVDYDLIRLAAREAHCPVLANGNISSAEKAIRVVEYTGAKGVMIGRAAIRYPWIFRDIHDLREGKPLLEVSLEQVREYIERLYDSLKSPDVPERATVNRLKKFLNFVGQGVDPQGEFLHAMRRTQTHAELFAVCDDYLIVGNKAKQVFPREPWAGVIARPNCEEAEADSCSL
jgi:tRNA-dihydrouridine synthase B